MKTQTEETLVSTQEEENNLNLQEEMAEGNMALAAELAAEDEEDMVPVGITKDEIKQIEEFEKLFGNNAHPLKVIVDLAKRVKELEKRVF